MEGSDIARRALEEARAAARASGKAVGQGRSSPRAKAAPRRSRGWSGARPDDAIARDVTAFRHDPELAGLVADQASVTEAIPIIYDPQGEQAHSPQDRPLTTREQQEQQQQAQDAAASAADETSSPVSSTDESTEQLLAIPGTRLIQVDPNEIVPNPRQPRRQRLPALAPLSPLRSGRCDAGRWCCGDSPTPGSSPAAPCGRASTASTPAPRPQPRSPRP